MDNRTKKPQNIFVAETTGDTMVISPVRSLGELEYPAFQPGSENIMNRFRQTPAVKNVVIDCVNCDYFGSTALSIFTRWWKTVSERKGNLVLCNVSKHAADVLTITRLDSLWPTYGSREDALDALNTTKE